MAVTIVILAVAFFGLFDGCAGARLPHASLAYLCSDFAKSVAFVHSVVGSFLASDVSGEAGLDVSVDAAAAFIDLAIAVVVESVAIAVGRLRRPIRGVVLLVGVIVAILPFAIVAGLLGSVADAVLFGAWIGRKVVVGLAIAIVVESVAIVHAGFRRPIGGVVLAIVGLCAFFPALFAVADLLFGALADAVLFGAWGSGEVVVDFSVAIVVDPIAFFGLSDDCADTCAPKPVAARLRACAARGGARIGALCGCASCLILWETRTSGAIDTRWIRRYLGLMGVGIADLCGGFLPAGGRGACAKHTSIALGTIGVLFAALLAWNGWSAGPQTEPESHQEADG